jgi:adenylate kinase family enzyme
MRRIAIVGNCGSGKTTLARELATTLDLTHIELDGLFHQPDWTPTPPLEFQAKLRAAMADADATTDGWTTCGNYRETGLLNQNAADTIVWLDMPRSLIMRRVIGRTVRRAITREVLWNGNREPMTNFYKWDPQENVIRWAWVKFESYRQQGHAAMTDGTWAHATVHHLRSPAEVAAFLASAVSD